MRDPGGGVRARPARRSEWRRPLAGAAALVVAATIVGLLARQTSREPAPLQVRAAHGAGRYAAPVRLDPDTSYVRSIVLPSGMVEVTHWIRTARAVEAVHLRTPDVPGLAPGDVYVTHVVLASNGNRMPVTRFIGPTGSTDLPLPPTHRLYIRYHLSGVLEHAGGSDDRALARITSLDVSTASRLVRTTRTVAGATVLSLACTPKGRRVSIPCGKEHDGTWSASLGPGRQDSQVMAQLNLS